MGESATFDLSLPATARPAGSPSTAAPSCSALSSDRGALWEAGRDLLGDGHDRPNPGAALALRAGPILTSDKEPSPPMPDLDCVRPIGRRPRREVACTRSSA